MIEVRDQVFALHGEDTTLLMRVNEYGLLEQLHFGERVEISDAEAFICHQGLGWGESVLLKEGDTVSVRGEGRFVYRGPIRSTKSGNLAIEVDVYV